MDHTTPTTRTTFPGHPSVTVTRVPASPARERHGAELPGPSCPWPDETERPAATAGVTVRLQADRLEVALSGDVDLALAADLTATLATVRRALAGGSRGAHLDVRAVTALDSTALRFVEELRTVCVQAGVPCSTSTARPAVQRVLDLVRPLVDGQLTVS